MGPVNLAHKRHVTVDICRNRAKITEKTICTKSTFVKIVQELKLVITVLVHVNGVAESVEDERYFSKIIAFADFLKPQPNYVNAK